MSNPNDPCENCLVSMICDKKNNFTCHIKVRHINYIIKKQSDEREIRLLKRTASYDQGFRMAFKRR